MKTSKLALESPGPRRPLWPPVLFDESRWNDQDLEHLRHQVEKQRTAGAETKRRVGPFQLLRVLGRGGMGTVYLAERADGAYQQQVAVKVMHRSLEGVEVLSRFLQERQILADLEHPNIARLLDGGTTEEGQAYLVLEYVEGLPIDVYCDRHRLDLEARVKLFLRVLDGVQAAHRRLIVHRDLKPENILVDQEGGAKLLDFGIAKPLRACRDSVPEPTRSGLCWLTPSYASPEQIRGGAVTTSSDIYSLGVVLYALLAGRLPFRFCGARLGEILRVLDARRPLEPSKIFRRRSCPSARKNLEDLARRRGTTTSKLHRALKGDLDNIVTMALHRESGRRYGSVEEFAEDLRRWLSGLPVRARADTLGYRATKFVRRQRATVTAVASLLLLLLGFSAHTLEQARALETQRDLALEERRRSEEVSEFLVQLLAGTDPFAAGSTLDLPDLLERGVRQVRTQLSDQPQLSARLLHTLGKVYQSLGLFEPARDVLAEALSLRSSLANEAVLAESLEALGWVEVHLGHYQDAEALQREALALRLRLFGEGHPSVAASRIGLGVVLHRQGDLEGAEPLLRQALRVQEEAFGGVGEEVGRSRAMLAWLLLSQGRWEEGRHLAQSSLKQRRLYLGEDHPEVAEGLDLLARFLFLEGNSEGAEEAYRDSLRIRRRVFGETHPQVATGLNNLATMLDAPERLAEAEELFRQALQIFRQSFGEEHENIAAGLNNLGRVHFRQGRHDRAEEHFRRALELVAEDHPLAFYAHGNLGEVLLDSGAVAEAEEHFRRALDQGENIYPLDAYPLVRRKVWWGLSLVRLGRLEEARSTLAELPDRAASCPELPAGGVEAVLVELERRESYRRGTPFEGGGEGLSAG